jgi:hypothetical protein
MNLQRGASGFWSTLRDPHQEERKVDFIATLGSRAAQLVGRRIRRVRYDRLSYATWNEFGPELDVDLDSILFDFEDDGPGYLTWSNECGQCYGISLVHGVHWADEIASGERDAFETEDVSSTSQWSLLIGESIIDARIFWNTMLSEEIPPSAITLEGDRLALDLAQAVPLAISSVPQELALRFESGRWIVISVARYEPDRDGLMGWMDEILVVHDEDFARRLRMGPFAPPSLRAPE